jgi:hypothetical protein
VRRKALLFLQKKKQKNFYLLGALAPALPRPVVVSVSIEYLANRSHGVIASVAKQFIFRASGTKDGLLRCARHDAVVVRGQGLGHADYSKSFLLLFFKKEALACLARAP